MKDRNLMCVTEILDDSTGIWAGDLVDFGIYTGLVEQFLATHGEKGKEALIKTLEYLIKRVNETYDAMKEAKG